MSIQGKITIHPIRHRLRAGAVLVATLALGQAAHADIDWSTADWGGYSPDALNYWQYRDAGQRSVNQMQRAGQSRDEAPAPPTLSTTSNLFSSGEFKHDDGLELLARMYPRDEFYQRKKQYRQIVMAFNQSVDKLYGVPPNNLATGMTVALAGAYSAYHQKPFPDGWVKRLYRQMEQGMLDDPRLAKRTFRDRGSDYQVMVGAGMVLLMTQAELQKTSNPDAAARLRQTGAQTLRALTGAEPDRVDFSSSGMRVR